MPQKKCVLPLAVFLFSALAAWGNESSVNFDISASVDWRSPQVNAQTSFNLAQAGLRLPAGRVMGEDILQRAWLRLFRPHLLSLRVDSSSTLGSLVQQGDLSLQDIDAISRQAQRMPASLSVDMAAMIGRYTVCMTGISGLLLRHQRLTEPEIPLLPVPAADYTGIIIIADRALPVRGRHAAELVQPTLFPRIWDTQMNLIYDRSMMEASALNRSLLVRYAAAENVFRPTPSGLEGELAALAGARPLRIFAREVFGIYPTDPVIDRDDALRILSSAHNRRLLREGRVVLVLHDTMLGN